MLIDIKMQMIFESHILVSLITSVTLQVSVA